MPQDLTGQTLTSTNSTFTTGYSSGTVCPRTGSYKAENKYMQAIVVVTNVPVDLVYDVRGPLPPADPLPRSSILNHVNSFRVCSPAGGPLSCTWLRSCYRRCLVVEHHARSRAHRSF